MPAFPGGTANPCPRTDERPAPGNRTRTPLRTSASSAVRIARPPFTVIIVTRPLCANDRGRYSEQGAARNECPGVNAGGRQVSQAGVFEERGVPAEQVRANGRVRLQVRSAAALGAGGVALLVYGLTLAPSIVQGDSAELTVAAHSLGVPHSTGYPLYMLLGWVFTHLAPLGDVAARMNLFSAVCAAAAVGVAAALAGRLLRATWAGLGAALLFGFSLTFWSQAVVAEVYALHVLLTGSVILCLLAWDAGRGTGWLRGAALLYGLCFTHHLSSLFLAPALLWLVFTSRRRAEFRRELRWTLPLFLVALLLYAYLPLAARRNPAVNWNDPVNWDNFLYHVLGRQYRGRMFQGGLGAALTRFQQYVGPVGPDTVGHLQSQFSPLLLPLALVGLVGLLRRQPRWGWFTLLWAGPIVFWAVNYAIPDIDAYFLGAHLVVAIWIAAGAREVAVQAAHRLRCRLTRAKDAAATARGSGRAAPHLAYRLAALLTVTALPASALAGNWERSDRSRDRLALTYGRAVLESLAPDALLIAGGDNDLYPALYAREIEQRRPDVAVAGYFDCVIPARARCLERLSAHAVAVNVPPDYRKGPAPHRNKLELLSRIVNDNVDRRPIYLLGRPVEYLRAPKFRALFAPYSLRAGSNVPWLEVTRHPHPMLSVPRAALNRRGTTFAHMEPGGSAVPALELLGVEHTVREAGGVTWLRLTYDWRVLDPALARQAVVHAIFGDDRGNYERLEGGVPEFQNIHALGQTHTPGDRPLPMNFREEFELYIPPRYTGAGSTPAAAPTSPESRPKPRPYHLWLSIRVGDARLRVEPSGEEFLRVF